MVTCSFGRGGRAAEDSRRAAEDSRRATDELCERRCARRLDGRRADVNVASRESAQQVIDLFKAYPLQSRKHQEILIWKQFVESSAQWSYTKQSFDSFERVRPHFEALAKRLLQIQKPEHNSPLPNEASYGD